MLGCQELEQRIKKTVIIQADPTLHWEQYDIYWRLPLGGVLDVTRH
jgi:hypothetical protein